MENNIKFTHGGARPGAGRKPLGKVAVQFRMHKSTKKIVEDYANTNKITLSDAIENIINSYQESK